MLGIDGEYFGWIFGLVIVGLYGWNRFHEETPGQKGHIRKKITSKIFLKDLTMHRRFSQALAIYIFILMIIYVCFAVVGKALAGSEFKELSDAVWPAACALLFVGLLPNLPWCSQIEMWLRSVMHERAMVIRAVDEMKVELSSAAFNLGALSPSARKKVTLLKDVEQGFIANDLDDASVNFIRSGFIISSVEEMLNDRRGSESRRVGRAFFEKYAEYWAELLEQYDVIREQVDDRNIKNRAAFEKKIYKVRAIVERLYDDIFGFVGCAILNRPKSVRMSDALKALNLDLSADQAEDNLEGARLRYQADAMLFSFSTALLAVIIAYTLVSLTNPALAVYDREAAATLPRIEFIGSNLFSLIVDYCWVGLLIFIFFRIRGKRIEEDSWFYAKGDHGEEKSKSGRIGSYARMVVISALSAIFILFLIDILSILGSSNECKVALSNCLDEIWQKLSIFVERNWLRIFYGVLAVITLFVLLENITAERKKSGLRKVVIAAAFVAFFDVLSKFNLIAVGMNKARMEAQALAEQLSGLSEKMAALSQDYPAMAPFGEAVRLAAAGAQQQAERATVELPQLMVTVLVAITFWLTVSEGIRRYLSRRATQ